MTVDHVIPKSIEVIDCKSNYVGACLLCNSEKSSKSFSSFVRDKRSDEIKVAIELIQQFKKAPSYIKNIKSRANYNKSISALRFELNERSSELRPRIKIIEHHCKIINKIMEKR